MLEIKVLCNSSNKLLGNLIEVAKNSIQSSTLKMEVSQIAFNKSTIQTHKIKWWYPYQAELFETPDEDSNIVCFFAFSTISSSSNIYHVVIGGYVRYEKISESSIELKTGEEPAITFMIEDTFVNPNSANEYYEKINSQLEEQLKFSKLSSANDFFLEKIRSIEDLEELDIADDSLYLDKIQMLQKVAFGSFKETKRVWGEYSLVSQITKQPVLMNKAMSIPLKKEDVADLMDDLNERYKKTIKLIAPKGKIDLLFSVTTRGHHAGGRNEIVLPKLGDWRFGYTDLYSAELIFHEFSHALDNARIKYGARGKSDVHKHEFVQILDSVLLDYSDWINSKYNPIIQRQQFLTVNEKLNYFYENQKIIEYNLTKKEREESLSKKEKQDELYKQVELNDNSYPLSYIIGSDENQIKKNYILYLLDDLKKKGISPTQKNILNAILTKLDDEKIILDKQEMILVQQANSGAKKTNYIYSLPLSQQISALSEISTLQNDITDLSKGIIKDLKIEDKYRVRSYDEASKLKKYDVSD